MYTILFCGERGIISTSCPQFSMDFGSNHEFSSQLPSCYWGERGIISTSCPQFSMVFGSNPGFSSLLPSFYCGERGLWTITFKLLYIKYFTSLFLFGNPLRNQAAKRRAWLSSLSFFRFHKDNEPKKISKRISFFFNFLDCIFIFEINVTHHFVVRTKMIVLIFCFWQKSWIF